MDRTPETLIARCARVAAASPHVTVGTAEGVEADADALRPPTWDDDGMDPGGSEATATWLLTYNAVNFCYWPDAGPRWWTVVDGRLAGRDDEALGIMAAFASALRGGAPLADPGWLASVDTAALSALLAPGPGAGALPLLDLRAAALRELGGAWGALGGPMGLLAAAGGSALRFTDLLAAASPTWEDERASPAGPLSFRKRLYLCAAMLHAVGAARFPGDRRLQFSDIERLPVFADYRLPQILRDWRLLVLAPPLSARIAAGELLPAGSEEEVALRAGTVAAAEALRATLAARGLPATSLAVDHLLWRSAVARQDALPPFHKTRCTDY